MQTQEAPEAAVSQELVGQLLKKAVERGMLHGMTGHTGRLTTGPGSQAWPGLGPTRPFCSCATSSLSSVWHLMSSLGRVALGPRQAAA